MGIFPHEQLKVWANFSEREKKRILLAWQDFSLPQQIIFVAIRVQLFEQKSKKKFRSSIK